MRPGNEILARITAVSASPVLADSANPEHLQPKHLDPLGRGPYLYTISWLGC